MAGAASRRAPPRLSHEKYIIGWICALPKELAAARAMLDELHADLPKAAGDTNTYCLGRLGNHNVAVACLPKGEIGTHSAALVSIRMMSTFESIRFGLMVGIGGGVPSKHNDIRLGDVVVSMPTGQHGGVIQWDFGKATADGTFNRTGSLNRPPATLMTALARLESKHEMEDSRIPDYLLEMAAKYPKMASKYTRPASLADTLFTAKYRHVKGKDTCENCEADEIISRPSRTESLSIHYGLIASGNQVMKNGVERDQISKELGGALSFEMEAAGLMNGFPCIVIRGICDYADSHKNDDWQEYAAATAAAYAKELLLELPAEEVRNVPMMEGISKIETSPHRSKLNSFYQYPLNRKVTNFVPRDEIMRSIHDGFSTARDGVAAKVVVLLGLGGCGKSQLALQFCNECENVNNFNSIFWIDASSPDTLGPSFSSIAQQLSDVDRKMDIQEDIQFVITTMSSWESSWLMVFDNYDDPKAFRHHSIYDYFPKGYRGCILVTSRHAAAQNLGQALDVSTMEDMEAQNLFFRRLEDQKSQETISEAQRIIGKLGNHALAIDQSSAYIQGNRIPVAQFMDEFDSCRREVQHVLHELPEHWVYKRKLETGSDYETELSVFTTWELSFKLISGDPSSREGKEVFVTVAAFLDNKDLIEALFSSPGSISHVHWMEIFMRNRNWSSQTFRKAVKELSDLSLLQSFHVADGKTSFSIHPLVQEWIKLRRPVDDRRNYTIHAIFLLANYLKTFKHKGSIVLHERLIISAHLEAVLSNDARYLTEQDWIEDASLSLSANQLGIFALDSASRHNLAEDMFRRSLASDVHLLGAEHEYTLSNMDCLARALSALGQHEEAEQLHRKGLEVEQRVLGPEHRNTLTTMHSLARVLTKQGQYTEAEELLQQVLQAREKDLGAEHPSTLNSRQNLAKLLAAQGKTREGAQLYRDVLKLQQRVLGPEHPSSLTSMHNLAQALAEIEEYTEAEQLHLRVLEVKERVQGLEHPKTLQGVRGLASIYRFQQRYEEAADLYSRCLAGLQKVFGSDHFDTVTCLNRYSNILLKVQMKANKLDKVGSVEEAAKLYRKALAGFQSVHEPGNPRTLSCMRDLAMYFAGHSQYAEAAELYQQAFRDAEEAFGPEGLETLCCIRGLATMARYQGLFKEASELYGKALAGFHKSLGADDFETLTCMERYSSMLSKAAAELHSLDSYDDAAEFYRKAIASYAESAGARHPSTLSCKRRLAVVLREQGRSSEAEHLLRETLQQMEDALGAGAKDTVWSVWSLAKTLAERRQYDEALVLYPRAMHGIEKMYGSDSHLVQVCNEEYTSLREERQHDKIPLLSTIEQDIDTSPVDQVHNLRGENLGAETAAELFSKLFPKLDILSPGRV
ncbi:MAG: hypothetical protein M1818_005606 [Claussenomyces sp. TS43310]|nr:MAG: hypothetical protein M1818_005606 [Claussenomyces sp. TS43310]